MRNLSILRPVVAVAVGMFAIGSAFGGEVKIEPCGRNGFEAFKTATLEYGAASKLTVENPMGDIEVIADPTVTGIKAEVRITCIAKTEEAARTGVDRVTVSLGASPSDVNTALAKATYPEENEERDECASVDWTIRLGSGTALFIDVGMGDLLVKDMRGATELKTGMGDIDIKGLSSELCAVTGMGDINAVCNGPAKLNSGMGDVELKLDSDVARECTLSSGMGDVVISLRPGLSFELEASSGMGELEIEYPRSGSKGRIVQSEQSLKGTFGAGGPKIVLNSGMGDVELHDSSASQERSSKRAE